jgi:hypothetical protein
MVRMVYDPSIDGEPDNRKDASIEAEAANRAKGIFEYLEYTQFTSKGIDVPSPQPPKFQK